MSAHKSRFRHRRRDFVPAAINDGPAPLAIARADDPLESEADAVADRVTQVPADSVAMRKCEECEAEDELRMKPLAGRSFAQAKHASSGQTTHDAASNAIASSRGGGESLPRQTRSFMESRLGADLSNVRIHTDDRAAGLAADLNARAFTVGSDIYFNAHEFAPESGRGAHLLAHELAHVLQQDGDRPTLRRKTGDGHDLVSPRLAANDLFQKIFDNKRVMEVGDRGPEVRRVQQMLTDLGISLPGFGTDGKFGAETEKAVKKYQHLRGLVEDGRVGFATIGALDADFPAFTLPSTKTDPWTMDCILQVLCPWNKNVVENVLPTFDIVTFDSREFPVHTWDGTTWVESTFKSGGFRSDNDMGFLNTTTCEMMAFVIYHEGWHGQQPAGMTGVVESERDAYISGEQWSIDVGIPGKKDFVDKDTGATRSFRTTKASEPIVDEPAADTFVRQKYGGVSSAPGERILERVGSSDVKVLRLDGTLIVRPARPGESVRGDEVMTNLKTIDKATWVCP
jgi:hypothetical protein